jgi:hypothetical protein
VLDVTAAPDQVEPVRVYVIAPANAREQKIRFVLTATDKEGGGDTSETRFDAPDEGEREND